MTLRDQRIQQLDDLKSKGITPAAYIVEELNCSFIPRRHWEFDHIEEAEKKYGELRDAGIYPAFLKKYAAFDF